MVSATDEEPVAFEARRDGVCVARGRTCAELSSAIPPDARAGLLAFAVMADGREYEISFDPAHGLYSEQMAQSSAVAASAYEDTLQYIAGASEGAGATSLAILGGMLHALADFAAVIDEAFPALGVRDIASSTFERLLDMKLAKRRPV